MIDQNKIKAYFPYAKDDLLVPVVQEANSSNDKLIKVHFLGQLAHESDGFATVQEYASGSAYQGRLGNDSPGDGIKYKGRGYIQLTGKDNYIAAGKDLGLDLLNNPRLLLQPYYAMLVSCWFWNKHGLDILALKDDVKGVTRVINGGYNGLADRIRCVNIFRSII